MRKCWELDYGRCPAEGSAQQRPFLGAQRLELLEPHYFTLVRSSKLVLELIRIAFSIRHCRITKCRNFSGGLIPCIYLSSTTWSLSLMKLVLESKLLMFIERIISLFYLFRKVTQSLLITISATTIIIMLNPSTTNPSPTFHDCPTFWNRKLNSKSCFEFLQRLIL